MHKMRDQPQGRLSMPHKTLALRRLRQITHPRDSEVWTRRCRHGGHHGILTHIRKQGSNPLPHQGLRNGAANAIAGPCDHRCITVRKKRGAEQTHELSWERADYFTVKME